MDSDDNLAGTTNLVADDAPVIVYPNEATEIVCSIIEDICPDLSFVRLSDFRTSVRYHMERHRQDGLVYRFLLSQFNVVDWDFVGNQLKSLQFSVN